MSDWRDKVKAARLPEKVVPVVLRGDLAAEHEQVSGEIEEARKRGSTSLAGSGTGPLEERLHAIEEEMRGSVVEFRMRALPRSRRPGDNRPSWPELAKQHPPREKDGEMFVEDRMADGINQETHPEALVKASVVEPGFSENDWEEVLGALTQRQFDELVAAAWGLNMGKVDIPFSSAGSRTPPASDAG